MSLDTWDEVRTAYHVARKGTVSGAAEVLGVHHATVIRHIDALEGRLGTKLFQRHARGYTPTEAGEDLLRVAHATDDQFAQLASRIKGIGLDVSGELIVTALPMMSPRIMPVLVAFQHRYPDVRVQFLTDERILRLEHGEAHVAIRAGQKPQEPDNIVQEFGFQQFTLCATQDYLERHGSPQNGNWDGHHFVGPEDRSSRAPFLRWLEQEIPAPRITFRVSQFREAVEAVLNGAGIGFLPLWAIDRHDNVRQLADPKPEWSTKVWIVTHVDLHRTAKVQTLVQFIKEQVTEW